MLILKLYYFVRGMSVTREYLAGYLAQCLGGDPWIWIQRYEEDAMGYFSSSGATAYEDTRIGIAILRAW